MKSFNGNIFLIFAQKRVPTSYVLEQKKENGVQGSILFIYMFSLCDLASNYCIYLDVETPFPYLLPTTVTVTRVFSSNKNAHLNLPINALHLSFILISHIYS